MDLFDFVESKIREEKSYILIRGILLFIKLSFLVLAVFVFTKNIFLAIKKAKKIWKDEK
jgi:hypothetical protein